MRRFCGIVGSFLPEGNTDKRAAAVRYHDGNLESDDLRQKTDGVGGVALRAETVRVSDEYPVHDIIKSSYRK